MLVRCTPDPNRTVIDPIAGVQHVAFCDPSGGSSDSMTVAIAHLEDGTDKLILDCVRERRAPFSPEDVVAEFAGLLREYGITTVRGDRYAGMWPRERFSVHGIEYIPSELVKSQIYLECLPFFTSGRVELLGNKRLEAQLAGLERKTARGGRDMIDHSRGAHDDLANAACGALLRAATARPGELAFVGVPSFYGSANLLENNTNSLM